MLGELREEIEASGEAARVPEESEAPAQEKEPVKRKVKKIVVVDE